VLYSRTVMDRAHAARKPAGHRVPSPHGSAVLYPALVAPCTVREAAVAVAREFATMDDRGAADAALHAFTMVLKDRGVEAAACPSVDGQAMLVAARNRRGQQCAFDIGRIMSNVRAGAAPLRGATFDMPFVMTRAVRPAGEPASKRMRAACERVRAACAPRAAPVAAPPAPRWEEL